MDKVREQFESFYLHQQWGGRVTGLHYIQKRPDGNYKYRDVNRRWQAWQVAYEYGRNASRRPVATLKRGDGIGDWKVYQGEQLVRGGFETGEAAYEWLKSNGMEYQP